MNIAILGTGAVGSALGASFAAAGHVIGYGSRAPGEAPESTTHAEAVGRAEVIITALPGEAVLSTLEGIGEDVLGDRVILDVSNAFTPEFALAYPNDSVARQVQRRFPDVRVVKSLSTMNVAVMTDPAAVPGSTVFLSGDDADAKRTVRRLLADLGWREKQVLDLGGIASAAAVEAYGLLFIATMTALQTPIFNIAVTREEN